MSIATNILLTAAGFTVVMLVFYDIYSSILRSVQNKGVISRHLNRALWNFTVKATSTLDRRRRHHILAGVGPVLMPLLIALFLLLLITGFAMIYLPRMDTGFQINEHATDPAILKALYFSGVTLLTIGYGDILPVTTTTRVIAIFEGAAGIAIISLSITYLVTVYSALERRRAVALIFYHQARQGADVAGFITSHFARGRFHSLTQSLREATRNLDELLESHLEYSVIHYFHPVEVYKGLPRAIFVVLETVAILNSLLNEKEYVEAGDHPDVLIADDSARYVLAELITSLELEKRAQKPFESEAETLRRQRNCFNRARRRLEAAGIKLRTDLDKAFQEYAADRNAWERQLLHFAEFLGYDWDEVTGDRSLADATDDEVAERHEPLVSDSFSKNSN